MRVIIIAVLSAAIALPAGAVSKRKQCRQACAPLSAACAQQTAAAGFGNLTKACKEAVLRRCVSEGPAVCATFCGNGVKDGGETCDGQDLGGATCPSLGFASGTLVCTGGCALDTRNCQPLPAPKCGNGAIDTPEQCDGTALGGATCASLGFASGGTLACTAGCAFDTHACVPSALSLCGNGVIDGAEQCDGAVLGGATCASLGFTLGGTLICTAGCGFDTSGCASQRFPKSGQTIGYGADINDGVTGLVMVPDDGTIEAGQSLSYVDNGDGTITDMATGLMWEAKNDAGGLHDKDSVYRWSGNGAEETIWDWLEDINVEGGTGLGGHHDWRIPNVKELESLASYVGRVPTVEPVFDVCGAGCIDCSCTRPATYWSSTTLTADTTQSWSVAFDVGTVGPVGKGSEQSVRAVRSAVGGSPACGVSDKCIFVTNGVSSGNLGGLAGADATCNVIATSAGLPGDYVAWLSDGTTNAITRVDSDGPYVTPAGDRVASSLADLTDGSLNAPIDEDERGTPIPLREAWTGTTPEGQNDELLTCSGWTTEFGEGVVGHNTATTAEWTSVFRQTCDRDASLYCIQRLGE